MLINKDAINTPYLKENLIAYIGNKRRLLEFLNFNFNFLMSKTKNMKTALDLFAGSGSVSRLLKTLGLEVYSNDWEYYSYILNYVHISINESDLNGMFLKLGGVDNIINILNEETNIDDKDRYISKYYAPKDDNNPDLVNERIFYTQYNAKKIDIIRHNIEKLYIDNLINKNEYFYLIASILYQSATCANTSGVFKAFHHGFGGRNGDALSRIMRPIIINKPPLIDGKNSIATRYDANEFVQKYKDKEFDLVYLDPPYNQHQYGSNYHLLNTIALWDKPEVNENIYINGKKTNKGAIRKDWINTKSSYCYKKTASSSLSDLLKNLNARYITLSYSTDGIIEYDELLDILNSHGSLSINTSEYTRYRGAKRSIVNTKKNIEYLFIVDTKRKLKSKSELNSNRFLIEKVRLMLNNPFFCNKDFYEFSYKTSSIKIELKHKIHAINSDSICRQLENESIELIKEFLITLEKNVKLNNIDKINLYIEMLEKSLLVDDSAKSRYLLSLILSCYTSLSTNNAHEHVDIITRRLELILMEEKKLKQCTLMEDIKFRIDYNKRYMYASFN